MQYGWEARSLTLREERRPRVFENTLGPRGMRMRTVEGSPNIVRVIKSTILRWAIQVAKMGKVGVILKL